MRWGYVAAVAALVGIGCSAAQATTGVLISGSGTFGADVTATDVTAPGEDFAFSFTEADPVTETNPFGGGGSGTHNDQHGYVLSGAGQFSLSIGGKAVEVDGAPIGKYLSQVTFYDDGAGGGFDLDFSFANNRSATLTIYTGDISGPGIGLVCDRDNGDDQSCTPGAFKFVGKSIDFATAANDEAASGTGTLTFADVTIPPPVSPAPEPAAWMMMVAGFGLIGTASRRSRNIAAAV